MLGTNDENAAASNRPVAEVRAGGNDRLVLGRSKHLRYILADGDWPIFSALLIEKMESDPHDLY